jgi:RNA polymerase sigma factor (sigma-70 family)
VNDQTDSQLLRAYAEHHVQPAFAELVRRHVDFVYSAAQRMVCDSHLAEDVTQGVFVALAKQAVQLADRPVLSGWLHCTARNIAAQTVRTDVRRRAREQEAIAMNELIAGEPEAGWEQIAPHLDVALGELGELDRDALLLRYFECKSAQEMAQTLGISDEAAQKRVSRAVEKLREFFSKRKITIGASGLAVLISANAVQSAPVGLVAIISGSAVLAGTAVSASTVITATKAIAMTALKKTIIGATLAAAIGTGIYEAHQSAQLQNQIQAFQRQQTPLAEQIQQLQHERDVAKNQLAALGAENEQLKSNQDKTELLKLRGEVTQLKIAAAQRENDSTASAAKAWLNRVNQLKQYVEQHPDEKIPEFDFLTDREWLQVADAALKTDDFETTNDFWNAMQQLRFQAESRFASIIISALQKYSEANNAQFPTDFSQLQPYCNPAVVNMLAQFYEIAPASIVKDAPVKMANGVSMSADVPHHVLGDWIITRKIRTNPNSTSRLAIFNAGETYWQSPPGNDDQ